MKHGKSAALLLTGVLIGGVLAGAAVSAADAGENAAINAALSHAGVKKTDATHLCAELGYEHGRRVYEVEFHVGRTEYSYDIDAASLEIISSDKEVD